MGGGGEKGDTMNILKITNNYKKVEMNFNVDYGKSQTDKTHFKPNVNVWEDLQGASNNVGMYDNDVETGKLRSIITNPSLDRAEVDEFMKNEYENCIKEVSSEKAKMIEELMKQKEQETQENKETTTQITD